MLWVLSEAALHTIYMAEYVSTWEEEYLVGCKWGEEEERGRDGGREGEEEERGREGGGREGGRGREGRRGGEGGGGGCMVSTGWGWWFCCNALVYMPDRVWYIQYLRTYICVSLVKNAYVYVCVCVCVLYDFCVRAFVCIRTHDCLLGLYTSVSKLTFQRVDAIAATVNPLLPAPTDNQ